MKMRSKASLAQWAWGPAMMWALGSFVLSSTWSALKMIPVFPASSTQTAASSSIGISHLALPSRSETMFSAATLAMVSLIWPVLGTPAGT